MDTGSVNDEIRMTKLEGMTNDQMTRHRDFASSSIQACVSFVIRHSCFGIGLMPTGLMAELLEQLRAGAALIPD
jgi:hypothetical protein